MSGFIFLITMIICFVLFYVVYKYFGKHEFYLLSIIYSILSFIFSFKLISILGLNINTSIIFCSILILMLYHFISRYGKDEYKKYIMTIFLSTIAAEIFMVINALVIPSIYDEKIGLFQNLLFENWSIFVLYPIVLLIVLLLGSYSFNELKSDDRNRSVKMIVTIVGISFIYTFSFVYFSYAFLIRFTEALLISLDNYLIMINIMIAYYLCYIKLIKRRKVK